MSNYWDLIDQDTPGRRNDVTPVFSDIEAFRSLLSDLEELAAGEEFGAIVGIDALGFILGAAFAIHVGKPFVPIRKGGKLPVDVEQERFVDYSGEPKVLEIREGALSGFEKVALIDEWIETGSQVMASIKLIERQGAEVALVLAINVDMNEQTRRLMDKYKIRAIAMDSVRPAG